MAKKNYNYIAAAGKLDVSDEEICADLGLDPALAGTPEINKAALEATMIKLRTNMEADERYDESDIKTALDMQRKSVIQEIKNAEKIVGHKLI